MRSFRITLALTALTILAAAGVAAAQVTPAASFDEALQAARQNDQLVVVDFYTDW